MADKEGDYEDILPQPDLEQARCRGDIWTKGIVGGLALLAPVVALGVARTKDKIELDEDDEGWDTDVLYEVALPALVLFLVTSFLVGRLSTQLGFDMLQESSLKQNFKEAIRTNMTNSGVVLALYLTVLTAMLQDNLDGAYLRNDMWYRVVLGLGVESCVRGLSMVSFYLSYSEPLDEKASQQFAVDNMIYIGEPVACVVQTTMYFAVATLMWYFLVDPKWIGCVMCVILGFSFVRLLVVMQYFSKWRNPHVSDEVRQHRLKVLRATRAVDGAHI